MTRRVSECGRTLRPQPWPQGFYQSVHAATIGLWLNLTHSRASSSNTSPASRHGLGPGLPALTDYSSMSPCWTRGSVVTQARRAKPASPQTGFPDLYAVLYFRVLSFSPRRLDPNPSPNPNLKCCFVSLKKKNNFWWVSVRIFSFFGVTGGGSVWLVWSRGSPAFCVGLVRVCWSAAYWFHNTEPRGCFGL